MMALRQVLVQVAHASRVCSICTPMADGHIPAVCADVEACSQAQVCQVLWQAGRLSSRGTASFLEPAAPPTPAVQVGEAALTPAPSPHAHLQVAQSGGQWSTRVTLAQPLAPPPMQQQGDQQQAQGACPEEAGESQGHVQGRHGSSPRPCLQHMNTGTGLHSRQSRRGGIMDTASR